MDVGNDLTLDPSTRSSCVPSAELSLNLAEHKNLAAEQEMSLYDLQVTRAHLWLLISLHSSVCLGQVAGRNPAATIQVMRRNQCTENTGSQLHTCADTGRNRSPELFISPTVVKQAAAQ